MYTITQNSITTSKKLSPNNMHVGWTIVTGISQLTRKLTELQKICWACNSSPKLALRTSVAAVTLLVN